MKRVDLFLLLSIAIIVLLLIFFPVLLDSYKVFNKEHGFITAFIKFALLATFGESLGLRIRMGVYNKTGFGLMPRAIVWGFLGLTIKVAFVVFYSGVPLLVEYLGIDGVVNAMKTASFTYQKLLGAFSISVLINIIYAPVMMTFHKITDTHILVNEGRLSAVVKRIPFGKILHELDWDTQWNFVFKKTIPFFWIPAHTITFMLEPDYQVLFAAFLGIALGLILAFANLKK